MYEIISDLWICKNKNLKKINMRNIIHINCEKDLIYVNRYKQYNLNMQQTIIKEDIVKAYLYIKDKIDIINLKLKQNELIIISCDTCETLSPLLINCFLIKYGKMNIQETILCLESKTGITIKDDIFFNSIIKKVYDNSKK